MRRTILLGRYLGFGIRGLLPSSEYIADSDYRSTAGSSFNLRRFFFKRFPRGSVAWQRRFLLFAEIVCHFPRKAMYIIRVS